MHDLIVNDDEQGFESRERNSVVRKFQMTLQHLKYVDKLLVHFESFRANANHYSIPEILLNGLAVFHLPPSYSTNSTPQLNIPDFPNSTFMSYWKPLSSLELDIWHRWLHAHRIHILLNNDYPLPKVSRLLPVYFKVIIFHTFDSILMKGGSVSLIVVLYCSSIQASLG